MGKIIKVTSNIKSVDGRAWSQDLSDLNILIGPNESGKSAIAEAVQLATSGSAYGLFFRSAQVKAGNQLGKLSCSEEEIFAEVEYEDGSTSRWEMNKGGRPKRTGEKTTILPVAELRDALSGSATRARHFFGPLLIKETFSRESFEKLLPNKEVDLSLPLEKILPDYGKDLTVGDVIKAYKACGSWKRDSKSMSKASDTILKQFSLAEPMDHSKETQLTDDMQLAVKLEWLKKLYKEDGFTEEEKSVLGKLALHIADRDKLKELKGSAQYFDEISALWVKGTLYRQTQSARKKAKRAEEDAKSFETLEQALDVALMMLLTPEITKYCRRVNKFLPKGDKFGIRHDLKGFSIFLKRGDVEHYALSGSTEARVLAAMGAALSTDDSPTVLVLDDRMWDAKTLARTMERLEHSSGFQAVLMSTFKPRGRARAKWNYVEISPKGYDVEDEEVQEETQIPLEGNPLEEANESYGK